MNSMVSQARKRNPMRANIPLSVPVLTPEMAAPLIATAPAFPNICTCGEEVVPERLRNSWVFYCQRCGNDWSSPAPPEVPKPRTRQAIKRCGCAHKCRFCGGER